MENGFMKGILALLVVIYVVSPIDFVPGPVDDIILLIMTYAVNKRKSLNKSIVD